MMLRITVIGFVLALLGTLPATAQDFQKGVAGAERGDYATALKQWRPLAEQGNAAAQYNVGLLYDTGKGVPQHYGEAAKWYRKAAEQGNARAQYELAFMYGNGRGVRQNYVLAHQWLNISAAIGYKDARVGRDDVARLMTRAQVAWAQRLARKWWARHMKSRPASPRAASPPATPLPAPKAIEKMKPPRRGPAGV